MEGIHPLLGRWGCPEGGPEPPSGVLSLTGRDRFFPTHRGPQNAMAFWGKERLPGGVELRRRRRLEPQGRQRRKWGRIRTNDTIAPHFIIQKQKQ